MMLPHRALRLPAPAHRRPDRGVPAGRLFQSGKDRAFPDRPPVAGVQVPNRLGTAELKDVSLPEYAADQEVAFQTGDGAVRSNSDNLWADDPPGPSPRRWPARSATCPAPPSSASLALAQPPARILEVRVERALAQADTTYRLSGRYFVSDDGLSGGGTNHARSFDIRVPMTAQGPAATAAAASQAISILAQQIATLSGPGRPSPPRVRPRPIRSTCRRCSEKDRRKAAPDAFRRSTRRTGTNTTTPLTTDGPAGIPSGADQAPDVSVGPWPSTRMMTGSTKWSKQVRSGLKAPGRPTPPHSSQSSSVPQQFGQAPSAQASISA